MKKLALIAVILALGWAVFAGKSVPSHCADPKSQEAAQYGGYDPEEAFAFGLRVQEAIRGRDAKKLIPLIHGELKRGPRKARLATEEYLQIFGDKLDPILTDKPECTPVGSRGFMLGRGLIWYGYEEAADEGPGGWSILSIPDWEEEPSNLPAAWMIDGTIVHPRCFFVEWASSDNYEELIEDTLCLPDGVEYEGREDGRMSYQTKMAIMREIGQCLEREGGVGIHKKAYGKSLAIDPIACSRRYQEKLDPDLPEYDGISYQVKRVLPLELCNQLAPHMIDNYSCEDIRLVAILETGLGSWNRSHANIYGLFSSGGKGKRVLVPLANLETVNEALNYIDGLEKKPY